MNLFAADLHIHTVLSPCGDLEMSPGNIIARAAEKALDVIAITDHNHTGHARLTRKLGKQKDIWVVYGAEVNTCEDVHCLAYFDGDEQLDAFQQALEDHQPGLPNDPEKMGDQVIVNEAEEILDEVPYSLLPGLSLDIESLEKLVHKLGGLFVPAHIDRPVYGLYAQLGIFPDDLVVDAVELSYHANREKFLETHPELEGLGILRNSDAHYLPDIGKNRQYLQMEVRSFDELRLALHVSDERKIVMG